MRVTWRECDGRHSHGIGFYSSHTHNTLEFTPKFELHTPREWSRAVPKRASEQRKGELDLVKVTPLSGIRDSLVGPWFFVQFSELKGCLSDAAEAYILGFNGGHYLGRLSNGDIEIDRSSHVAESDRATTTDATKAGQKSSRAQTCAIEGDVMSCHVRTEEQPSPNLCHGGGCHVMSCQDRRAAEPKPAEAAEAAIAALQVGMLTARRNQMLPTDSRGMPKGSSHIPTMAS